MSWTLDETLRPVATRIDPALISGRNMARIMELARHLPGTLTSRIGFECPLGTPEARADLLLLVRASGSERETLAGLNVAHPFAPASDVWMRLQSFAARWADPGSVLAQQMSNVWLEFDMPDDADIESLLLEPNIFIGPTETVRQGGRAGAWLTHDALPSVTGRPADLLVLQRLERCVAELPDGASVTHLGAMLQRPHSPLRLVVSYIAIAELVPYLERIGWKGPLTRVEAVLRQYFHLPDFLLLDLDVGADVLPRIGIEGLFSDAYKFEPKWPQWLDDLERGGLCLPEKRRALEAFPGLMDEVHHRDVWPEALLRASAMLDARMLSTIFLSLHHIKVVLEAERPLSAKGYIGAGAQWMRPERTSSGPG